MNIESLQKVHRFSTLQSEGMQMFDSFRILQVCSHTILFAGILCD